jgi:hypothetical protein
MVLDVIPGILLAAATVKFGRRSQLKALVALPDGWRRRDGELPEGVDEMPLADGGQRTTRPPRRDREVFEEVTDYDEIRVREQYDDLEKGLVLVATDTAVGEDEKLIWVKEERGIEIPLPPTDAATLATALLVELQHLCASDEYPELDEAANRELDIARSHVENLAYRLGAEEEENESVPDGGETNQYANTLTVDGDMLQLPEPYATADALVVRSRSVTQDYSDYPGIGEVPWVEERREDVSDEEAQNPDLDADEVRLKIYGEEPELFRVREAMTDGGGEPSGGDVVLLNEHEPRRYVATNEEHDTLIVHNAERGVFVDLEDGDLREIRDSIDGLGWDDLQ